MGPYNPIYPPGYNPAAPAPGGYPHPGQYPAGMHPAPMGTHPPPGAMPYGAPGLQPYPTAPGLYPGVPPAGPHPGLYPGPYPHSPKGGHHKKHHHGGPNPMHGALAGGLAGAGMGIAGHVVNKKMKKMKKMKKGHKAHKHGHHKHGKVSLYQT